MIYFSLLLAVSIFVLMFTWNPIAIIPNRIETKTIEGPGVNMTVITTIENQTTKLTNATSIITYNNSGIITTISNISAAPIGGKVLQIDLESLFSNREVKLVLIATLFGVMEASVQSISSLVIWNSSLWYLARPLIGAALAVITYLIIRVGLIPSPSGAIVINDFGVAAIGALVGLMADEMSQKLRDIFDSLFGIRRPDEEKGEEPKKWIRDTIKFPDGDEIEVMVNTTKVLKALVQRGDGSPLVNTRVHFSVKDPTVLEFVGVTDKTAADVETNTSGEAIVTVKGISLKSTTVEASATLAEAVEVNGQVKIKVVQ